MAAGFSTHADEALSRTVEHENEKEIRDDEISKYFQTEKCIAFLQRNFYEKVALQFPDEYLKFSFKVSKQIQYKLSEVKLVILGDTTYGSCCVDDIAAEHVKADCIIHYGTACLSKTRRLPVLFIFGEKLIDVQDCCLNFKKTFTAFNEKVILFYDVAYEHAVDEIYKTLKEDYENFIISKLMTDEILVKCEQCCQMRSMGGCRQISSGCCKSDEKNGSDNCSAPDDINISEMTISEKCCCSKVETDGDNVQQRFGRKFILPVGSKIDEYNILYIGKQTLTLTNLMMSYNKNKFYTYDPDKKVLQRETLNVNKSLMKRYYLMQKAKEAKTVGIVAATLGVADYLLIIEQLKKILKKAGKKFYTFMMGKPNVAKMANYMEIDVFVLVACPENSLIDSQEFYRPIVTPFEMEIACSRGRDWTGEYITDFRELLPGAASYIDFETQDKKDEEEPEYSLVTGGLIKQGEEKPVKEASLQNSTDVVLRNQENAVTTFGENSSAYHLSTRSWKGLERKLGETEVVTAVEGRTGTATNYTHETVHQD